MRTSSDPQGAASDFAVDPTKITAYLLNVDHPEGGAKARFFIARGFDPGVVAIFIAAVRQHAVALHFVRDVSNEYGVKRVYEGPLACPDGTAPHVRSVWHKTPGSSVRMLVTAYPIGDPARGGTV
ncbi:DUF6883 domain-containing protein [Methylobacterium indicum]|uniref:DUF6883 domain-containing protein n=1 Tax=Methylobacterium indicum TaxID=1775910 RepID=UPI0024356F99|nr:DUF6883 domain-containing protein [Methylobacterium indicum]